MALDVLAQGRLVKAAEMRTAKTGKPFAVAKMAVATDGDESMLCSLIAFRGSAAEALLALGAGDACAVAGQAKVTAWTGRDGEAKTGLSIVVEAVLTAYHVKRRRQAVQGDANDEEGRTPAPESERAPKHTRPAQRSLPATAGMIADMPDDDPFGDR